MVRKYGIPFLVYTASVMKLTALLFLTLLLSCSPDSGSSSGSTTAAYTGAYIYVASGTTYAGNAIVMSTPVNVVSRFQADGTFDRIIRDYSASPNDTPIALAPYDADHILVAVENAAGRRIEIVAKDGSSFTTWVSNTVALTTQLRDMISSGDGGVLVSKGGAIEKFSSAGARVLSGANPYVNAPAAPCATATTLITRMALGPSGSIFFGHAAASPNNKIDIINPNGYSVATDCYAGLAGPTANHWPTALLYHSSGYLLVAFGNNTGPINQIYSYTVTSNSISAPVQAFNNSSVLQGISYLTEDSSGNVYAAAASSSFNTIEKFTFNPTTETLTRVGTVPFIGPNIFTRSVSAILIE